MKRTTLSRVAAVLASAGLVAGLGACADNGNTADAADDAQIKVVTSTKVWADIADAITDDKSVSIEPIIESNEIDPHSYQPSAADMAKVSAADILVAGGGHYDAWLTAALDNSEGTEIISALATDPAAAHDHDHDHDHAHEADHDHDHDHDAEHDHDHAHEADHDHDAEHDHDHDHDGTGEQELNEHIWYDTAAVAKVAEELTAALSAQGADASTEKLNKRLSDIDALKKKLPAAKVAQVHPLGDDILKNTKIQDITPEKYRKATLSESEPSAADINEMLTLINSGELDYLLDAPQTHDQVSERLVDAARAKGVPIVNIYESPAANQSFLDLYEETLENMKKA